MSEEQVMVNNEPVQKKSRVFTRDSNIELLRIICMIFIIAHHFSCHNGFTFLSTDLTFNRFFTYDFLYSGGKIGVDVFVLITGFFMYKSESLHFDRVLKLWTQLFTINFLIYIVFVLCGQVEFTWLGLLENMLPISFEKAWFVSAFFVLTLLTPALNVMIKYTTQKRHLILIIVGFILWVLIPTFIFEKTYFFSNWEYNSIIWFMFLYVVGAYIAKYVVNKAKLPGWGYLLISFGIFLITLGITIGFGFLSSTVGKEGAENFWFTYERQLFEMESLPVFLISVLLLIGFSKIKLGSNKVINFISATTFGIYLIHDNTIFRTWMWHDVVRGAEYQNDPKIVLVALIAIIAVFVACSAIEIIRQQTLERLYKKPLEKLGARIDNAIHESMPDKQIIQEK